MPKNVAATTVITRVPPRTATDLWDDLLRVAGRVEYTRTGTVLTRNRFWLIPALLTLLVASVGVTVPGLWTDEFATWGLATTPWHEFWWVLRYVDAVLAPYYVLMHGWVSLFGDSDLALRAPSVIAMALSAGLIAALGARLCGRRAGLLAGLVFAILPSTSRFAAEARPYALGVLAAVAATYLLVRAVERPGFWRWSAYSLAVAVLGMMHIVGLLLVAAHAWVVLAWHRRLWWQLALAAAVSGLITAPLLYYGAQQRNQVSYIPHVSMASFAEYADIVLGGVAVALIVVVVSLFSLPLRYPSALFTAWAVLPVMALIVFSLALPMFLPRYLLYTSPGWALLAGVALARPRRLYFAGVTLLALAVLAVPAHLHMRRDDGHQQQASRTFAGIVAAQARPGDAIVYADDEPVGSWTARDLIAHYVPASARPRDVLATNPPRHAGLLLATETREVGPALAGVERLWVLRVRAGADPLVHIGPRKESVLRERYDIAYLWRSAGYTLILMQRKQGG